MSLMPFVDLAHGLSDLAHFDEDFDDFLDPHNELLLRRRRQLPLLRHRPYNHFCRQFFRRPSSTGISTIQNKNDKFEVALDVQQFAPEEVQVKVVDNNVIIEAKHEERQDEHGYISRQFTRKYMVPEQCNIDDISTTLSSDGVLMITVPKKALPGAKEKIIKIQHTGKPALKDGIASPKKSASIAQNAPADAQNAQNGSEKNVEQTQVVHTRKSTKAKN